IDRGVSNSIDDYKGVSDRYVDNPLTSNKSRRSIDRGVNDKERDYKGVSNSIDNNTPLLTRRSTTPSNTINNPYVTTPLRTNKSLHSISQHSHPIFFRNPQVRKSKRNIFLFFLFLIFLTCYLYVKHFCKYCTDFEEKNFIKNFCVPKPKNLILFENEFVCKKGYIYKKKYFCRNLCVKDLSVVNKIRKSVDFIVGELQICNWKYIHGIVDSNKISIEEIKSMCDMIFGVFEGENTKSSTRDNINDNTKSNNNNTIKDTKNTKDTNNTNNTIKDTNNTINGNIPFNDLLVELEGRKGVLRENNNFYTFDVKVPIGLFIKFYILKIFKILIIPIFTIFLIYLIFKYEIKKRKKNKKNKEMADLLVKDILEALSLQVLHNSKDKSVISCVALTQLKDYFGIEDDVWVEVVGKIRRNSNVRENMSVVKGEEMRVWEWIGPIIGVHGKRMSEG
ncbi:putative Man1/Src1p histone-binding protein, partial [Hamiltosporidium magnivora]